MCVWAGIRALLLVEVLTGPRNCVLYQPKPLNAESLQPPPPRACEESHFHWLSDTTRQEHEVNDLFPFKIRVGWRKEDLPRRYSQRWDGQGSLSLASFAAHLDLLIQQDLGEQGQGQVCLEEPWGWCVFQNLHT